MMRTLTVNGTVHEVDVDDDTPLLWVLRDTLGLTGTKYACGVMACGACTVLLDGAPVRSCGIAVATLDAAQDITTIEGLPGATRDPVQRAWAALSVAQCGYCQSGMVLQASALLAQTPAPSDAEIDRYMTNLCRCGSYQLVRAAIRQAANAIGEGDARG